jgi:hypothetical protein
MDVKFYAAITASTAAPPSSITTVNVNFSGVVMSNVKLAQKGEKFTLAHEPPLFASIPQEQLIC